MVKSAPLASDMLQGVVLRFDALRGAVLLIGPVSVGGDLTGEVLRRGDVVIGYGLAFLYEEDALLPRLVIDDFQREYRGREALDFMLRRGDAFPRADVFGRRVSTGTEEWLFLKQLDLAGPLRAFVYGSLEASRPLARLRAAIWLETGLADPVALPEDDERVPAFLRRSVPCFGLSPLHLPELPRLLAGAGES
ncbi:MAG TPA: hypothetical protein ENI95_01185 [Chloroflexi bacterium]|nr:hypothetical protein [Chloroflexota bacterium]